MCAGTFKHWDTNPAEPIWLINTRGSASRPGPAQTKPLRAVKGHKVPTVHIRSCVRKCGLLFPWEKANLFMGFLLLKDPATLGR